MKSWLYVEPNKISAAPIPTALDSNKKPVVPVNILNEKNLYLYVPDTEIGAT